MRVGLVRVDPDARPHVGLALGDRDDRVPFLLAGRDVEEAGHAARPRRVEHLALALGEPVIDQVAMAIDQAHAAAGQLEPREGRRRLRDRRAARTAGDQVEQALRRPRHDRRDRRGELAHRLDDRAEHARHPLGIALLEAPRRHRVDIGIAGEHRAHPRLDPRRKGEAVEFGGQRDAPLVDRGEQSDVLDFLSGGGKDAVQVLEHHRQTALGEIAEAVGELGIDARRPALPR